MAARRSTANERTPSHELIERRFAPLRRHPCWGLHFDPQLNLTLNFGRPSLRVREPFVTRSKYPRVQRIASRRLVTVRGQWWLWLFCCYWQVKRGGKLLATGGASCKRIDCALNDLHGQKLTSVAVDLNTGASRFVFDLGCELTCRRFEADSDSDVWTLYGPNDIVSVTGQGTVHCEEGSESERSKRSSGEGRT